MMRKTSEQKIRPDIRTVLHFHPALAPVKIGVLPLSKKLNEGAEAVFTQLSKNTTANLMTEEILVKDTADRMRLELLSVLHTILIQKPMVA